TGHGCATASRVCRRGLRGGVAGVPSVVGRLDLRDGRVDVEGRERWAGLGHDGPFGLAVSWGHRWAVGCGHRGWSCPARTCNRWPAATWSMVKWTRRPVASSSPGTPGVVYSVIAGAG